ncbi:MAG: SDR family NAD(P)-dependent oxidoreductase [Dehalococcoidia bacterium]|nr:SDR family NAD(P)-dependent oxidoreductase [Dehalococcoidia bacterium]
MILSLFGLTNRVAIVTGAGRGIGKGIALGFAEAGADIVIAEIDPALAEETAGEIRAKGRKALVAPTDVRIASQVDHVVEQTLKEFGKIDILVNNAGGWTVFSPVLGIEEQDWDRCIELNLKGAFLCCKAVGKVMVRQKRGAIVNISSLAGFVPFTAAPHYGAAKAAVANLTQTLAMELAPHKVRVNAIAPGSVETDLTDKLYSTQPGLREYRIKTIPLGRLGRPQDIAAAALYLASDAADWVTGETLMVRGGMLGIPSQS